MSILDDLKGILGDDAIAKLEGSPLKDRIMRGDEVATFLDKGEVPEPRTAATSALSLDDLTNKLNEFGTSLETKLMPKFAETVDTKVKTYFESEAPKFRGEVLANAIKMAHETAQIERKHEQTFNEPLNLDELDKFAKESGRTFSSPSEAWDEWTREKRFELEKQKAVDEAKKTFESSRSVPGVSPTSVTGVRAALRKFGQSVDASGKTRAEQLNERLAQMQQA